VLKLSDVEGNHTATSEEELEIILMRRHEKEGAKVNSVWLAPANRDYPLLSILVRDQLAYAWYTPSADCAGFNSASTVKWIDQSENTEFFLNHERQPVQNNFVITFAQALLAAKEFFRSTERPTTIEWDQLWEDPSQ
jgi:Immunity protein Imm1